MPKKMPLISRAFYILLGLTLTVIAVLPTPDDFTVVSPIAQFVIGVGMMVKGVEGEPGWGFLKAFMV